ncbi:MAG TPA: hypothetical protein DDW91_17775 [Shewanella frigidimarina]|nr:hypothetical protein [Shewanella frigidimarina]
MIDLPPTYCDIKQVAAVEVMTAVNLADLSKIKSANTDKKILRLALDNYVNEQLSVSEFSIMIYEGCEDE